MLPDGRPYYTMKLVQGIRLDEMRDEAVAMADRLRTFLRICEPVAFAHAHGVLHRDLKPANIMIGPFGEVLIMDWGLARIMASVSNEASATKQLSRDATDATIASSTTKQLSGHVAGAIEVSPETKQVSGQVMGDTGASSPA